MKAAHIFSPLDPDYSFNSEGLITGGTAKPSATVMAARILTLRVLVVDVKKGFHR